MIRRNKFIQTLLARWMAKLCSLVLAILLFVFGRYANQERRTVTVPVSIRLPSEAVAVSTIPSTVTVEIRGEGDVVYLVNPEMIRATVDFSGVKDSGIANAPVVLSFNQTAIQNGSVGLEAKPSQFRVMFELPGQQP